MLRIFFLRVPMEIEYLTSNPHKFAEARHILSSWHLIRVDVDLPEIQGDAHAVITAKAKSAFQLLQRPLIVEDVSLSCRAIGGLPGPYVKDFLQRLGSQGLYELIHKYDDHSVEVACLVAYIDASMEPVIFTGMHEGIIVAPRSSSADRAHGWNPIVQPLGQTKTYAEMTLEERSQMSMRFLALTQLDAFLKGIKGIRTDV